MSIPNVGKQEYRIFKMENRQSRRAIHMGSNCLN